MLEGEGQGTGMCRLPAQPSGQAASQGVSTLSAGVAEELKDPLENH